MKRILSLLIIGVLVVGLIGCSGSADNDSSSAEEVIEIKLAGNSPVDDPATQGLYKFEEEVERLTNGKVDVKVYPAGQLGTGREIFEAVQQGSIEMCVNSVSDFSSFSKDFLVFNLPYLFKNLDVAYEFLDGPEGQKIAETVDKAGFKILAYFDNGFRNVTNNVRPVKTPDDLNGLKIRTMQNPVHMELFTQMGANPTPMAYSEVFTALQQNTVDGQENSFNNIHNMKFNEVQKYITDTHHAYDPSGIYMNLEIYNGYPEDIREAIDAAAKTARDHQRGLNQKNTANSLESCKATSEVIELTDEERLAFKEASKGTYDVFADEIGAERLDEVIKAIEEIEKKY